MLKFLCPPTVKATQGELRGAHLLGTDGIPARGAVRLENSVVHIDTRVQEPLALSLLWSSAGFGTVQLETTRLPAREAPYALSLELARHRLMRINLKREEWGLYDYPGMEDIAAEIDVARDLFLKALEARDPQQAAELGDQALTRSLIASEDMTQFHAGVFLGRRTQARGFGHPFLGATVPSGLPDPGLMKHVGGAFDFARVPLVWRNVQPGEHKFEFSITDDWVKACRAAKLPIQGGPLLAFGVQSLPDWMYIWENDPESIIGCAEEFIRTTVKRYAKDVRSWLVASGLHATDALSLNFEHIIEMTRMAATITRKHAPNSQIIIDLTQPWGEYFARNPRTVPPLLYAEMVNQTGIPFDAFGLQFLFGIDADGYHLRDLLQVSALLDRLANLGKPMHITAVSAPSACDPGKPGGFDRGGQWRKPWSPQSQADWLVAFSEVVLSKPFVESVCLHTLADGVGDGLPACGVLAENLTPKVAVERLAELRRRLRGGKS